MRLLITLARAYPWQSATMLLALLLAGVVEGLSLTALLPLLSAAIGEPSAAASENDNAAEAIVTELLGGLGMTPTIGTLLIIIVGGITLKSALVLLAKKRVGYTVARVTTNLRLALLRALLTSRWEYYLRQPVGSLANAMATEAIRASSAYFHGATVTALLIQVLVYASVGMLVSWKATLVYLGAGIILLYVLHHLVRMTRRAGMRQTKLLKSLLTRLTDSLMSVKPIRTMARENLVVPLLEAETTRLNRALEREVFSKEARDALQEPLFAALVAIGLYLALIHWDLPLASVMVLVLLLVRVLDHLGKVQRQYQKMVSCESAFWSLQSAIQDAEREREASPGKRAPRFEGAVRLNKVRFGYADHAVLQNASLTFPAGSFTTLVGPSGVGKTTLVDLLTGLLQPQEGEIWIDDLLLEQVDLRRWRQMIGYVPQETVLLHDTILNNVTLGDPDLNEEDAERALRAAGAWAFVAALPAGLNSSAGERGARLSGGQRQRIAIARALAHKPRLLILDEATSALDPESEAAICATLQQLRGRLTILAISHQPALVNTADRVYRLQGGTAVLVTDREATRLPSGSLERRAHIKP